MIQANSSITLNNQPFPAESFFQVIEKKTNPNNEFVLNAICERKTYSDLLDSIISNQYSSRYMSQKRKIMFTGLLS